jgi:DNA-binding NarL/FixJ family response regulator
MPSDRDPISVVLATDSFLVGDGLAALLDDIADVEVVGRARDYDELLQVTTALVPEAVIIAIRTPVISTMATIIAARRLRAESPELGIVVISDRTDGFARELLRGGASRIAFLLDEHLPGLDAVLGALRALRAGQSVLDPSIVDALVQCSGDLDIDLFTLREVDVLEQMAHGLSNRAVAAELHVSTKAVEKSVTIIFRKLGLDDHTLVDRRVIAALTFLRSRANPFAPPTPSNSQVNSQDDSRNPESALVARRNVDDQASHARAHPNQAL